MAWDDWLPVTRGYLRERETLMNATIAQFKADMEAKLATANAKLDNVVGDEAGQKAAIDQLKADKVALEARIAALEAQGSNLSPEDAAALADLQVQYQVLVDRVGSIADAIPDAAPTPVPTPQP
jgi:hypothetical protein